MSEIRQDPTTEEWVIIAKDRARRPQDFVRQQATPELPAFSPSCPFCPGNESMTPPEVLSYRDQSTENWRVRVLGNRFPALTPEGSAMRRKEDGFFLSMDGMGVHEVIVETPVHNKYLALMDESAVEEVLLAYKQRYEAAARRPFVKLIVIFKNHGQSAGTSLEHPHSQLVATPVVPRHIRLRHEVAIRYYDDTGNSLYSDLVGYEIGSGKRVVMDARSFVVFHPFASCSPFETWVMPKIHRASFEKVSPEELAELAKVLRIVLLKLYRGLNNPDFNYVIDSVPVGDEASNYYRWHMRIIPRLTEVAGFEIGSGIHINTALPEETARFMRELKVE